MPSAARLLALLTFVALAVLAVFLAGRPPSSPRTASDPAPDSPKGPVAARPEGQATPLQSSPVSTLGGGNIPEGGEDLLGAQRLDLEEARNAREFQSLLAQLHDPAPEKRSTAAEFLAAYPNPSTETALLRVLQTDPQPNVRQASLRSLAAFESPSDAIWRSLLASLTDPSSDVQSVAVEVLRAFLNSMEGTDPRMAWVRREVQSLKASPRIAESTLGTLQTVFHGEEASGQ